MSALSEVSLGDITKAASRYRPVAVTVAVVLAALAVLPEPRFRDVGIAAAPTLGSDTVSSGAEGPAPTNLAGPTAPAGAPPAPFEAAPSFDQALTTDFAGGEAGFSGGSEGVRGFDSGATSPASAEAAPLTVVRSGWWSRTANTPLGGTGVPEGTLPVGKRVGQDDKISFVELVGDGPLLTFGEEAEGARQQVGAPKLSLCPLTEEWKEGAPMSDTPAFDTTSCVAGSYTAGGTWSFDLTTYGDPGAWAGFAIVPAPDAPLDFQVNLVPA